MTTIEFVVPSVLNKGAGEKKMSIEASTLDEAFNIVSGIMGDDFKRRVIDINGKLRALINIYINGKNMRFNNAGMGSVLKEGDSIYILPAVAGGAEITNQDMLRGIRGKLCSRKLVMSGWKNSKIQKYALSVQEE